MIYTPDTIIAMHIGKIVEYSSVVKRVNCYWREDVQKYRGNGSLLLGPNTQYMPSLHAGEKSRGEFRLLIKSEEFKYPQFGVVLGKSTRQVGSLDWEPEVGCIFSQDGAIPVIILMPWRGTARYHTPIAVTEIRMFASYKESNP